MNFSFSRAFLFVSLTAGLSLSAGLVSFAPTAAGLINTGVDLSGMEDQSWSVLPGVDPAVVVSSTHSAWIPNKPGTSQWIWQDLTTTTSIANVTVWFELNFDLPASYDPASTTVLGQWAVDNRGTMYLNDQLITTASGTFGGSSKLFSDAVNGFSLSDHFLSGANVLKIKLENFDGTSWGSNPSGLNVRFLDLQTSVIPEPSVLLGAMTMGALGLLCLRRRR